MRPLFLLLGTVIYILLILFLRNRRLWLPYYTLAVFGLTVLVVLISQQFHLDTLLSSFEMNHTHLASIWFGIPTRVVSSNSIMIADLSGWSILSIGIECSAILELSIFIGLILFYPAFSGLKKSFLLSIGLTSTYLINVVRILLIVGMVHFIGKNVIFIAHAIVGRLFFFAAIITLYWFLLTRPTLDLVAREVRSR